ncbi:MAG: hypothetical protein JST83_11135 [Bacteroidetes bacterium]|nr:hypothetical protein [Bacteroidota bacterium]
MPFTSTLIQIINDHLSAHCLCDARFSTGLMAGIAHDATRRDDDRNAIVQYPVLVDLNGEGTDISISDTYPITIYHRIGSKTYTTKPAGSYGNRQNEVTEKTDVKLVVAAWSNRISLSQEDLEALITSNFPDTIAADQYAGYQLSRVAAVLQGSNLNREQVWKEEYKGIPYDLKPEQILFSIKYQIEADYKKGCFKLLECQN